MKHGLIQIYTGNGKGKTTAAAGLAARALSHKLRVCWISFFKGTVPYLVGETAALKRLGADVFKLIGDCPRFTASTSRRRVESGLSPLSPFSKRKIRSECLKALGFIAKIFKKGYDLIVLDEINIALCCGFLKEGEILLLLRRRPKSAEVVLTGRGATPGLVKAASLVTEMKKLKHPFDKGIKARRGIEY